MKSTPSTGNKRVLNSQRKSSIDEEENDEERKSLNLSNRNVEEVLENLRDAEDELFERGDELESENGEEID
jgi:hypothetical protein